MTVGCLGCLFELIVSRRTKKETTTVESVGSRPREGTFSGKEVPLDVGTPTSSKTGNKIWDTRVTTLIFTFFVYRESTLSYGPLSFGHKVSVSQWDPPLFGIRGVFIVVQWRRRGNGRFTSTGWFRGRQWRRRC